jgi:hypothetical protein
MPGDTVIAGRAAEAEAAENIKQPDANFNSGEPRRKPSITRTPPFKRFTNVCFCNDPLKESSRSGRAVATLPVVNQSAHNRRSHDWPVSTS